MQTMNIMASSLTGASNSSGTTSTGMNNGSGNAGGTNFGQLLVQVIGGTGNGAALNAKMPNLAQLMANLLGNVSASESEAETGDVSQDAISDLLNQLSERPELLDQWMGNDDVQAWLQQAAMLLQAMQVLPENVLSDPSAVTGQNIGSDALDQSSARFTMQQAQAVIQTFAKLSETEPNNVFVQQLQENFAQLLTKLSDSKMQQNSSSSVSAAGNTNDEIQQSSLLSHLTEGSTNNLNRKNSKVTHADATASAINELAGKLQTRVTPTALSKLEMLAAKSIQPSRVELLIQNADQLATNAENENASSETDGNFQPFTLMNELNRLAPQKAALPAEAVIRSNSLVEDMSNFVLGKLRIQNANGMTEARLTLNPESLGQVEVKLSMQNGQLVAQFAAHTTQGKDVLESQLSQLRAALQNQGIQVEKLEVTQSPSLQSGMFQDQRQQQQSQQFTRQNRNNQKSEGNEDYAIEAAAILNGTKDRDTDGFDVTA